MEETMDKDKMLDYFNDREATLFRDELGSNARYHKLLQKKLAAEDAHRKMVGEAAWKQCVLQRCAITNWATPSKLRKRGWQELR